MSRLLWIGDAVCDSGFSRVTHCVLEHLRHEYEVGVLGINYLGDPHPYEYPIYPAWPGGDLLGVKRLKAVVEKFKPEVILINNDPWNMPHWLKVLNEMTAKDPEGHKHRPRVVGYVAIDGKNCRGKLMNGLDRVVTYTEFGKQEAQLGGCKVPIGVVPHGVDLNMYGPLNMAECRERLGLGSVPADAYIVGNVNRNNPRKRLDLMIAHFAEWVLSYGHKDAYLFLHVAPTGDQNSELDQLIGYYGLHGRVILAEPAVRKGVSEHLMAVIYNAMDVLATTTLGEGWWLPGMEAMACGTPVMAPDWSALGEWARPAARLVPCSSTEALPIANNIGGVVDRKAFIDALEDLYRHPETRQRMSDAGLALVERPEYRWKSVARQLSREVKCALGGD